MEIKDLVKKWFTVWETGNFQEIPVTDDFKHTSPYGTIPSKKEYLKLVEANRDKFLGNRILVHDEIYGPDKACVRYTVSKDDFTMEVSEWLYRKNGLIQVIIAYYNIEGEISEERKLSEPLG